MKKILYFLLAFFVFSCADREEDVFISTELKASDVSVNYILNNSNHNAFPDLVKYKDVWFIAYRESTDHLYKGSSKIKVLKSLDFRTWNEINVFEIELWDLRDPKFSINESTGELYLHLTKQIINSTRYERVKNYTVFEDEIGAFKTNLSLLNLDNAYRNDWLWHPIWVHGNLFANGYSLNNGIRTYSYSNIKTNPKLLSKMSQVGWSEASSQVVNDSVFTIVRTNENAKLGVARLEEDKIDYKWRDIEIDRIGGPNIKHFKKNLFFIAGRVNTDFRIYLYDSSKNSLNLLIRATTQNADSGYSGMQLDKGILYAVYYKQISNGNFVIEKISFPVDDL